MSSPTSLCGWPCKKPWEYCSCLSELRCAAAFNIQQTSFLIDGSLVAQISRKMKRSTGQASVGSMRIITGSAAGKRLVSPPGEGTRPMMEKVRGAIFNMVASMAGSQPLLPPGTRWLDLFAGTGNFLPPPPPPRSCQDDLELCIIFIGDRSFPLLCSVCLCSVYWWFFYP